MDKQFDLKNIKKIFMLYNRHSGKQLFNLTHFKIKETQRLIKVRFGFEVVELVEIERFDQIGTIAERIKEEQVDWVIIAGGDGTIRAALEKLVNLNYRPFISIFPSGTVNLVAKELQLSSLPQSWLKRLLKGRIMPVYFGWANNNLFLTVASAGFDSLVVENVTEREKLFLNKLAYVFEGGELIGREVLFSNWRYRFQVRFDDEEQWVEGSSVIVGKSRYYAGRYNIFKKAALDNPKLYAAVMTGAKKVDFLAYAANMCLENLDENENVIIRDCEKLSIKCNVEGFAVELDGDAITATPLEIVLDKEPLYFVC